MILLHNPPRSLIRNQMKITTKSIKWGNNTLTLETGKFAPKPSGSVYARYSDTAVLATVCSGSPKEDLGYFPLSVDFVEKLYAGGRISSSRFIKRENRPSEKAVLTGRLVDRSIRPLFPKEFTDEVQVIITVLSVDQENDPDFLSIIAASAAIAISDVPWNGPLAAAKIGIKRADGKTEYLLNPVNGELKQSPLDLVVSGSKDGVVMLEAGANEVTEDEALEAIKFAHKNLLPVIDLINDFTKEAGKKKQEIIASEKNPEIEKEVIKYIKDNFLPELKDPEIVSDESWGHRCVETLREIYKENTEISKGEIAEIFDDQFKEFVRDNILDNDKRLDGRKSDEVRPINIEVGLLPRTHGSAFFQRGATHILTIATLGSPTLEQLIEGMEGEDTKRYMHHYNFPPFSTGEVKRLGSPNRREIGHGALAERAILPVIPPVEEFPYAIRMVSETMSSSGSTSMGSTCGSTLALMDAGVPIKKPVAGIAMGVITKGNKYKVLTDIGYTEDANGDMDFKIAGTKDGITAIQMDIKIQNVSFDILKEAINGARKARLFILEKMLVAIPEPRKQLSKYAPKIKVLFVDQESIGEVIGPGGKIIRGIIASTGATVDIDDDGKVTIGGETDEIVNNAVKWVLGITKKIQPGEEYDGTIKRVVPFGAFVEVLPGKEGLVHSSQMPQGFVATEGAIVHVWVREIDDLGRVNLTMLSPDQRAAMTNAGQFQNYSRPPRGGFSRGPRRRF